MMTIMYRVEIVDGSNAESCCMISCGIPVPMNMEEWQRKLKAEKEAARQKKTESAEILRGYRGELNDDELKLKALREEERKKHQDAQELLHNYKGLQLQEGMAKTKERPEQHFPTPVNVANGPRDVLDGIVLGSVSERAAALAAAAANAPVPIPDSTATFRKAAESSKPGSVVATTPVVNNHEEDDDDEDDDYGPSLPTNSIQPPVNNGSHTKESSAANDPLLGTTANLSPVGCSSEVMIEDSAVIEKNQVDQVPMNSMSTTISEQVGLKPLRVDVLFAFGLVTIQARPNLDSYMSAVHVIVAKTLEHSTTTTNPLYPPYVKSLEWDGTFLT
jgi:hypothetical protein